MTALTRRIDLDVAQETWRIYYGDVVVGSIAACVGNPGAAPKWQWRCGFYPGCRPGECTGSTAATFEEARADFETAWRALLAKRTPQDFPSVARSVRLDGAQICGVGGRSPCACGAIAFGWLWQESATFFG